MKMINFKIRILLFLFTTIVINSSLANSGKDSIPVDLTDSISVVNFLDKSGICEELIFVQRNLDSFLSDNSYAYLILIDISKETKRGISIPKYNHHGERTSHQIQKDYLETQVQKLISDFCQLEKNE